MGWVLALLCALGRLRRRPDPAPANEPWGVDGDGRACRMLAAEQFDGASGWPELWPRPTQASPRAPPIAASRAPPPAEGAGLAPGEPAP